MKKDEKAVIIDKLKESFDKANIGILTNYRGLNTADFIAVRKRVRDAGGKYEVVKNTMARFASEKSGIDQLVSMLTETTAIAFGFGEPTELAAAVNDYIRTTKTVMTVKGGFLGKRILTAADVITLATIPPREVLLAQLLGQFQAPIVRLLGQLNAPLSGLVNVLNQRKEQLEGGSE